MNQNTLNEARTKISNFTDKLGENFFDAIMEEDNTTYEMAKSIINVFLECETERDFKIADDMLMAACGYSFQTLVERIEELDEDGYIWESC